MRGNNSLKGYSEIINRFETDIEDFSFELSNFKKK